MNHKFELLCERIIDLSHSRIWTTVKDEWQLLYIYRTEAWGVCLCETDIKDHCVLYNNVTLQQTVVGNVCVNNFMGLETNILFEGVKRIRNNPIAAPNMALMEYCKQQKWLSDNEQQFLWNIFSKRKLSFRQENWRRDINNKILMNIAYHATFKPPLVGVLS